MWQRQVTRRRFLGRTAVAAGGILLPAAAASRLAPAALGGQAICVCDATMIWQRSMDRAQRLVEERTGLPAGSILISASHSHAAPRIIGMVDSPIDNPYQDCVESPTATMATCPRPNNTPWAATRRGRPSRVTWRSMPQAKSATICCGCSERQARPDMLSCRCRNRSHRGADPRGTAPFQSLDCNSRKS